MTVRELQAKNEGLPVPLTRSRSLHVSPSPRRCNPSISTIASMVFISIAIGSYKTSSRPCLAMRQTVPHERPMLLCRASRGRHISPEAWPLSLPIPRYSSFAMLRRRSCVKRSRQARLIIHGARFPRRSRVHFSPTRLQFRCLKDLNSPGWRLRTLDTGAADGVTP
jgi:hypothetical protein